MTESMTTTASRSMPVSSDVGINDVSPAVPSSGLSTSYEAALASAALAVLSVAPREQGSADSHVTAGTGQQDAAAPLHSFALWPDTWRDPPLALRVEHSSGSGRGLADTPNSRKAKSQSPGSGGSPHAFGTTAQEFEEMLASITRACRRTDSGAYSDSSEATTVVSEEFFGQPPEEPDWLMASMAPRSRQTSFVNPAAMRSPAGHTGPGAAGPLGASPLGQFPSMGLDSTTSGPDSMRHFYQRSTTSGLYEMLGGWEGLSAAVARVFRELCRDPRVGGALDAIDAIKLKQRLFTLLSLVLAGRDCPEDVRLWEAQWLAASDLPLSVEHFDVMIEHVMATLDDLTDDPAVMDTAASILSRQRNVLHERSSRSLSSGAPSSLLPDNASSLSHQTTVSPTAQNSMEPVAPRSGRDSGDTSGESGDDGGGARWDVLYGGAAGSSDVREREAAASVIIPPWLAKRGSGSSGGSRSGRDNFAKLFADQMDRPPCEDECALSPRQNSYVPRSGGGGGASLQPHMLDEHPLVPNRSVPLPATPQSRDAAMSNRTALWPHHHHLSSSNNSSGPLLMTCPLDNDHTSCSGPLLHHQQQEATAGDDEGDDVFGSGVASRLVYRQHHQLFHSGSNAPTLSAVASTSSLPYPASANHSSVGNSGTLSHTPLPGSLYGRGFLPSNASSLRASFGSSSSGLIAVAALRRAGASANAER